VRLLTVVVVFMVRKVVAENRDGAGSARTEQARIFLVFGDLLRRA
jgi:hypothetical protein